MKVREEEAPGTLKEPEPRPQELSPFSCSASPTKSSPCILLWGHPRSWGGGSFHRAPGYFSERSQVSLEDTRQPPPAICPRANPPLAQAAQSAPASSLPGHCPM